MVNYARVVLIQSISAPTCGVLVLLHDTWYLVIALSESLRGVGYASETGIHASIPLPTDPICYGKLLPVSSNSSKYLLILPVQIEDFGVALVPHGVHVWSGLHRGLRIREHRCRVGKLFGGGIFPPHLHQHDVY